MTGRLVTTVSAVADLVMRVPALPERGGDVVATSAAVLAGGGVNAAVAAARDGVPVLHAGLTGTGPFGDVVRTALAADGVALAHPPLPGVDTGWCVALVEPSAERTFATAVGAEGRLGRAHLDAVPVRPGDTVLASGYSLAEPGPAAALPGWLEALDAGVRVVVDPSPLVAALDAAPLARVLARADVLSASAREAAVLCGDADAPPAAAAERLLGMVRAGGLVVVRDGADGCWLAGAGVGEEGGVDRGSGGEVGGAVHVPGLPVTAVDTSGAGDCHTGVLVAALARGLPPVAAAQRACAAAAIAVTRPGPATAPNAAETDALLREQGTSPGGP